MVPVGELVPMLRPYVSVLHTPKVDFLVDEVVLLDDVDPFFNGSFGRTAISVCLGSGLSTHFCELFLPFPDLPLPLPFLFPFPPFGLELWELLS